MSVIDEHSLLGEHRAAYERWALQRPLPAGVRCLPAPEYGPRALWVIREPPGARAPIMVYVHGGGFRVGSTATGRVVAAALAARCPIRVLVVGYRLAPEHPFPAAAVDVATTLRSVHAAEKCGRLLIAGDSAGANLALFALRSAPASGAERFAGALLFSPLVDLDDSATVPVHDTRDTSFTHEMFRAMRRDYLGGADAPTPLHPDVSPLRADLSALPPLFVQYSASELIAPSIAAFVERARASVDEVTVDRWTDESHFWQRFVGETPAADEALDTAATWIDRMRGKPDDLSR